MVAIVSGSLEEFKSVLVGGACQGWLPDVSVVLWRRMLGALGDVNKIDDPAIHASVFEHLCDLQDTLQRVGLGWLLLNVCLLCRIQVFIKYYSAHGIMIYLIKKSNKHFESL